jgi:hypothetical protein
MAYVFVWVHTLKVEHKLRADIHTYTVERQLSELVTNVVRIIKNSDNCIKLSTKNIIITQLQCTSLLK